MQGSSVVRQQVEMTSQTHSTTANTNIRGLEL